MNARLTPWVLLAFCAVACDDAGTSSDPDATNDDDGATDDDAHDDDTGSGPEDDDATADDDATGDDEGDDEDDEPGPAEDDTTQKTPDETGMFGEPEVTFTLPEPARDGETPPGLYFPELLDTFPEVDWANLDRLYLPAGEYQTVLLGGLPERSATRPLVITNVGGQVKVGGHAANYVFSIRGGSNWVLTGRYDEGSQTGDAAFTGHAGGAYAHSQGSYGIFIDDAFSKAGLSGLAVGGGATAFELDMLEVTRAEFAGIVVKTDDDGSATMRDVSLHDLYVHDVGSEGLYLGSTQAQPQHTFERLSIFDNRFLRTGTEALQVGQLADGCEIHHNVLGPAAIRWRSAFQQYQDGNVQYGQRTGSSSFHHNVVIGTGDLFVEFFPTVAAGDAHASNETVTFADNYFSDTSSSGVYTHADDTGVTIRFERNVFRGFVFNYDEVYPDASEPVQVFGVGSNSPNPHVLLDNVVDSEVPFIMWLFDSVTEMNNTNASVPRVVFRDFMGPELDDNYRELEWWTDVQTLGPTGAPVAYEVDDKVMHGGVMYQALQANQGSAPDENPDVWEVLPPPADDVRLTATSPHQGLGVR